MAKVFISRKTFAEALDILREGGIDFAVNERDVSLSKCELVQKIRGVDGLICLLTDTVDKEVIDSNSGLKAIANVAAGFDNIDVAAATERGVMVTNTPGVLTETTADLAFALLISAARRIVEADTFTRERNFKGWELVQPHLGTDVYGKTLGIVGMGRVGMALTKRASQGFDMNILYWDPRSNKKAEEELDAQFVSFDVLLERSDFISIHVPLTEETRHLFGATEFKKMKQSAYLINTSRGPVVDEAALAKALRKGKIRGAGIDVYEEEPRVHPELLELKQNVVLTPHIGSASLATRTKMAVMAAQNMVAALQGSKPPNLVNKQVFIEGKLGRIE